jgi:hypothetical protein
MINCPILNRVTRNHLWVVVKNFPVVIFPLVPMITLWRYFVQLFLAQRGPAELRAFTVTTGFVKIICTVARANLDAVAAIPAMLRKRKAGSVLQRLSSREMCKLLFTFRLPVSEIVGG